jgi:hypothetical protein
MRVRVDKVSNFNEQLRLLTGRSWKKLVHSELKIAGKISGELLRANITAGIRRGRSQWEPIHPYTKALREYRGYGGSRPLVQSGTLSRNIEVLSQGLDVVVGVFRNVLAIRNAAGRERATRVALASVARMQETGYLITVTPHMREFFKRRGLRLKISTTHLRVPPRPFMAPAAQESDQKIREVYASAVLKVLSTIKIKADHVSRLQIRKG